MAKTPVPHAADARALAEAGKPMEFADRFRQIVVRPIAGEVGVCILVYVAGGERSIGSRRCIATVICSARPQFDSTGLVQRGACVDLGAAEIAAMQGYCIGIWGEA